MTLSGPDAGKQASVCLSMLDPSFVAIVPSQSAKSIEEAEHAFARLEPLPPSIMELPSTAQTHESGPGGPLPNGPVSAPVSAPNGLDPGLGLGFNIYQVPHLPDWHSAYTACVQHFVNHAQHSAAVQSLAAYINIRLPCQRLSKPIARFDVHSSETAQASSQVSVRHYIRRLVATGNDTPAILEIFFGAQWVNGVGTIAKQERLNYLFTAKSAGFAATKAAYDVLPDEHTPFLRPIRDATEEEISTAEKYWSEWMAMEDWMVGPRSPW
ncbi:uncharacterized protein BDW70DRAFT_128133 [Aspergillus foveolatus]|uniref:uncharacterized protein n=1 Tax=Aspergillus foveolatus TaxID=210207 RepID=UPI003CCE26D5